MYPPLMKVGMLYMAIPKKQISNRRNVSTLSYVLQRLMDASITRNLLLTDIARMVRVSRSIGILSHNLWS